MRPAADVGGEHPMHRLTRQHLHAGIRLTARGAIVARKAAHDRHLPAGCVDQRSNRQHCTNVQPIAVDLRHDGAEAPAAHVIDLPGFECVGCIEFQVDFGRTQQPDNAFEPVCHRNLSLKTAPFAAPNWRLRRPVQLQMPQYFAHHRRFRIGAKIHAARQLAGSVQFGQQALHICIPGGSGEKT